MERTTVLMDVTGVAMVRILITGSRNWTDKQTIRNAIDEIAYNLGWPITIVHGHCPTGADKLADDIAKELDVPVERHPADWDKYGKAAGPRRNQEMVDLGADVCLAFPLPDSRGTWDAIKRAMAADITTIIYVPRETQ